MWVRFVMGASCQLGCSDAALMALGGDAQGGAGGLFRGCYFSQLLGDLLGASCCSSCAGVVTVL
jgi:hypothetical protein